jgi:hypothetical protein
MEMFRVLIISKLYSVLDVIRLVFRKISGSSDDYEIRYNPFLGEDEQYYPEYEELFPSRVAGKPKAVEDHFFTRKSKKCL